ETGAQDCAIHRPVPDGRADGPIRIAEDREEAVGLLEASGEGEVVTRGAQACLEQDRRYRRHIPGDGRYEVEVAEERPFKEEVRAGSAPHRYRDLPAVLAGPRHRFSPRIEECQSGEALRPADEFQTAENPCGVRGYGTLYLATQRRHCTFSVRDETIQF